MTGFKTTLITCQQCGRKIMVRAADAERGSIICSHVGCGAVNSLSTAFQYDGSIVHGLPGYGQLIYQGEAKTVYPLQLGANVIGISDTCTVQVARFMHNGRCFISRRHCTVSVMFDKWSGQLRYQLQDGAIDPVTQAYQYSLNGTQLNGIALQKTELIDVGEGGVITLGGADNFQLSCYLIPPSMLETYRVELDYNPDRTQ